MISEPAGLLTHSDGHRERGLFFIYILPLLFPVLFFFYFALFFSPASHACVPKGVANNYSTFLTKDFYPPQNTKPRNGNFNHIIKRQSRYIFVNIQQHNMRHSPGDEQSFGCPEHPTPRPVFFPILWHLLPCTIVFIAMALQIKEPFLWHTSSLFYFSKISKTHIAFTVASACQMIDPRHLYTLAHFS